MVLSHAMAHIGVAVRGCSCLRLESWPVEVLLMTRKQLEADEVCVLVSEHSTIHENVVMLKHELAEALDVERSTHAYEQL